MTTEITIRGITARVGYDDQGPGARGWHAEYTQDGQTIDDSQKIWHPEMPIRHDAQRKAERIARSYLRTLARD